MMKMLESLEPGRLEGIFLLVNYGAAVLLGLPLVRGHPLGKGEVAIGALRGLSILVANYLLLRAVATVSGYLVFAVYGALGVLVNVLAAVLIWGERPKGGAGAGIVLALGSIVVLNL
jgi:multidrug transporter EmrE-like cation transporter